MGRPAERRAAGRQVRYTLIVTPPIGLTLTVWQLWQDLARERRRMERVGESILVLVEPAAARAAYTYDQTLATTVTAALLDLTSAARVEIADNLGTVLASGEAPPRDLPLRWLTDAVFGASMVYRQSLSPPSRPGTILPLLEEPIGTLDVELDTRVLAADLLARSATPLAIGLARTLLLALVLTAVFYALVTRPLARLADAVGEIDPLAFEDRTLKVGRRHRRDELGRIAFAINDLLGRFRRATAERAQEEARRRASERHFLAAVDAIPDGLAILDANDRFVFFNHQLKRTMHANLATTVAVGACFEDCLRAAVASGPVYHDDMGEDFVTQNLRAHQGGAHDALIHLADERWIRVRSTPMPGGGRVILSTDTTERTRIATELRRAEKLSAVGTLAGGIAHDFNNLLATVFSSTEVALAHRPDDGPASRALERVLAAGRRGRHLVEQIMVFSRTERRPALPINLGRGVELAVGLCRPALDEGVRVEVVPPEAPLFIAANNTQIHRLVANLCLNAAQAMPEGGTVRVGIATETRDGKHVAVLSVADHGIGMDAPTEARLFEAFFTTKPVGRGGLRPRRGLRRRREPARHDRPRYRQGARHHLQGPTAALGRVCVNASAWNGFDHRVAVGLFGIDPASSGLS